MQHILVPLLTPEDVAAIPKVVEHIQSVKPLAVVVIHNPSLGITPAEATAKIDKELSDLENSKKQAIAREDFEGAATFKRMIEDKKLERQDALRDGWKSVPQERRMQSYEPLVQPFVAPWLVRQIVLQEDASYDNLLNTLANMSSNWPDCLPQGRFAILYPRSIGPKKTTPQPVQAVSPSPRVETAPKASKPPVEANLSPREARKKELSKYMKLVKVAKDYNITIEKGKSSEAVEKVLAIEFPEAVAA